MRALSKENVYARDELFATVDSTVRKVVINNIPFLLSDTVGFIRKLPHNLIESFKSTLDEVREADILLHVVDISHPSFEDQMTVVNETLDEIGAGDKLMINIYNKIDKIKVDNESNGNSLIPNVDGKLKNDNEDIFISALKNKHMDQLRDKIHVLVREMYLKIYPNYLSPQTYQGQ